MSMFKRDDLVRYCDGTSIYYIRVVNPGLPMDSNFFGTVVKMPDSNWVPFDARVNPDKVVHLVNSDGGKWTIVKGATDPEEIFMNALDNLEKQL